VQIPYLNRLKERRKERNKTKRKEGRHHLVGFEYSTQNDQSFRATGCCDLLRQVAHEVTTLLHKIRWSIGDMESGKFDTELVTDS
jgi:hypothetical protein